MRKGAPNSKCLDIDFKIGILLTIVRGCDESAMGTGGEGQVGPGFADCAEWLTDNRLASR